MKLQGLEQLRIFSSNQITQKHAYNVGKTLRVSNNWVCGWIESLHDRQPILRYNCMHRVSFMSKYCWDKWCTRSWFGLPWSELSSSIKDDVRVSAGAVYLWKYFWSTIMISINERYHFTSCWLRRFSFYRDKVSSFSCRDAQVLQAVILALCGF